MTRNWKILTMRTYQDDKVGIEDFVITEEEITSAMREDGEFETEEEAITYFINNKIDEYLQGGVSAFAIPNTNKAKLTLYGEAMSSETRKSIEELTEYHWSDEVKNYEETFDVELTDEDFEDADNIDSSHILHHIVAISNYINQ